MAKRLSWCVLLLGTLIGLPKPAMAQPTKPPEQWQQILDAVQPRRFYITQDRFDGSEPINAWAAGFHMAILYEVFDVTSLKYDSTLGATFEDAGQGPPTELYGWMRTGWHPTTSDGQFTAANCAAWTDNKESSYGAMAGLSSSWTSGNVLEPPAGFQRIDPDIRPWKALNFTCNQRARVWCVQDR